MYIYISNRHKNIINFIIALGGYQPLSQAPDGADSEDSDDDFAEFQTAAEQKKVRHHRRRGI